MTTRNPFTKQQLAKDLGITSKRLTKELLILEPDLKVNFPDYNKQSQILNRKVYKFILEEQGLEPNEIKEIMYRGTIKTYGYKE